MRKRIWQPLPVFGKFRPGIVIMDINMTKQGDLETTTEIKKMWQHIKVLMLIQYENKEYITRFLKEGVSGYLLKKTMGSDIITGFKAISRGE